MRLFQSQEYLEEHVPPPPYNIDREATRAMPVYLNQFRDGKQRLPTPEKVAIMELSSSFERRRLGKHQQILSDITQRCREQEVSDLCSSISAKVNLRKPSQDRTGKEMTFYSTNHMGQKLRIPGAPLPDFSGFVPRLPVTSKDTGNLSKMSLEKSYKNFPARKVIRQQTKFDFVKGSLFPKLASSTSPKAAASQENLLLKSSKLAERRHFHSSVQSELNKSLKPEHLTSRSEHLAPLILPRVGYNDFISNAERMDTYFLTNRVTLGPRTHTNVTLVSNRSGKGPTQHHLNPIKITYPRDLSQLHMETGGNSPPPNSEQELTLEAVTV